jgi:hypothetical protein
MKRRRLHCARPVHGKRRKELKDLLAGCKAGLVCVTAFSTREITQGPDVCTTR